MSAQHHILLFTASHLCRNPRVLKAATALGESGYDVAVLTIAIDETCEQIDRALMAGRPFSRIAIDHTGRTRLGRLSSLLERTGTWTARRLLHNFDLQSAQCLGPFRALMRKAISHRADLTVLHTEIPLAGAEALSKAGHRIAVDMEDWYSEDLLPEDRAGRPLRLLKAAESFALNNACFATTTSDCMAEAMAISYSSPRPLVVRNVFPLQRTCRLDRQDYAPSPSFVWFSQTIGPGRGLEFFVDAWSLMSQHTALHLIGADRRNFIEQLYRRIPDVKRRDLHIHGSVAPSELPDLLAAFDIGLALEPTHPASRDLTISNKLFQYMNAGLAVVATDTLGQTEILRQVPDMGLLFSADDAGNLARALDRMASNRGLLQRMQTASRTAAERTFSWEKEQGVLLGAVAKTLADVRPHQARQ